MNVEINQGVLAGGEADGVHFFKGIPYAAPISGERRWLPPQPAETWSGVRDATRAGNICPQEAPPNKWLAGRAGRAFIETLWEDEIASDDCLNLNVWTPSLDPEAKLPVMYWIHGGSFVTGSGSLSIYDGSNLAKKEVVVVSINYRLGLMGAFVAPGMFDDEFCGSNRGFRDQVAGLQWVHENIRQFGGDPDNITIFGESAGGQSVATLVASPVANQLFKKAIAQSGTPEIGAPLSDHRIFAEDLTEALKIKPGDRDAFVQMSAQDTIDALKVARRLIAKASDERYGELKYNGNFSVYGDDFMPLSILDALEQGTADHIDFMIGTVREDGRLFPLVMPGPEILASWMCMPLFKGLIRPRNEHKKVFEAYKNVMEGASNSYIRGQIMTDSLFRRGSVRAAEVHAQSKPGHTFLYQFNWSSPLYNGAIGAMHGIDVPFANQNLEAFQPILGELEPLRSFADTVSDAWVGFAKTGVPSASRMPEWLPFDAQDRATMVFDTTIELQYDVDRAVREIWNG